MEFLDLRAQYLSIQSEIDAAIAEVIRDSAFIRGPHVDTFEKRYAAEVADTAHCVSCANGTDAIYIALRALGLQPGEEVITTAHTWIATSETISQADGQVVFCDTEDDYYCIDPEQIARHVTSRTRGIIPVHLYGQPADMDAVMSVADKHDLWVIEDCAQAHLATYKGQRVGTFGDAATYSFYPGKNLGAMGDAGCLVTNRDDVADFARLFARHGGKGQHVIEGINSRMDGLQAAILNVKLDYIHEWTEGRRHIADQYDEVLGGLDGITIPARRPETEHVFHQYTIRHDERDALRAYLDAAGVPSSINYPRALPFYPAYDDLGHTPDDFPTAYRHMHRILSLPIYPEMCPADRDAVFEAVASFRRTLAGKGM